MLILNLVLSSVTAFAVHAPHVVAQPDCGTYFEFENAVLGRWAGRDEAVAERSLQGLESEEEYELLLLRRPPGVPVPSASRANVVFELRGADLELVAVRDRPDRLLRIVPTFKTYDDVVLVDPRRPVPVTRRDHLGWSGARSAGELVRALAFGRAAGVIPRLGVVTSLVADDLLERRVTFYAGPISRDAAATFAEFARGFGAYGVRVDLKAVRSPYGRSGDVIVLLGARGLDRDAVLSLLAAWPDVRLVDASRD